MFDLRGIALFVLVFSQQAMSECGGRPSASLQSKEINADAILAVARDIPGMAHLTNLANKLGFGIPYIMALEMQEFKRQLTAQRVLLDWVAAKGKEATGEVLSNALRKIELSIVAEHHQDSLLGEF